MCEYIKQYKVSLGNMSRVIYIGRRRIALSVLDDARSIIYQADIADDIYM